MLTVLASPVPAKPARIHPVPSIVSLVADCTEAELLALVAEHAPASPSWRSIDRLLRSPLSAEQRGDLRVVLATLLASTPSRKAVAA